MKIKSFLDELLTIEQRPWWTVQSMVPNFICPANWMEAFLSSGRSARHGGHHCGDATINNCTSSQGGTGLCSCANLLKGQIINCQINRVNCD